MLEAIYWFLLVITLNDGTIERHFSSGYPTEADCYNAISTTLDKVIALQRSAHHTNIYCDTLRARFSYCRLIRHEGHYKVENKHAETQSPLH